ncbi:MAG: serine/threonine-protein kinase [Planctomycetota bacterium]|nr:serine/threonine-protein kinase [Planctomycetota bacterium]
MIAERFLDLLKAGKAPSRRDLVAAHPEIAQRLDRRLCMMEIVHGDFAETASLLSQGGKPNRVGRYKILDLLGEGGMAVVYLAEQSEPVQRRVALKLIKPGLDTDDVVARFETEKQALAMMDHPGIAKVFDAGATESGRPYFVMEYVAGVSLVEYCDRARLPTTERLHLFQRVCEAVQHAHQKGIIHRDLKPTNILVAKNGTVFPKIIDFGIAKATNQRLTERTFYTEMGQIIGTPEYMSPEQAGGRNLEVDTRTDIYSLGVVLYEILTGDLPFDSKELREAGYEEISRRIREDEPEKPSTRVSTLGEKSTRIADMRRTNPSSLVRLLRGDLDWITMKAMEKDPVRRYATVSELSDDLRRHLESEPVLAGPPSVGYRLGKFVRRHKGSVAAGVLLTLSLAGGFGTSTAMYLKAKAAAEAEAKRSGELQEARLGEERLREAAQNDRNMAQTEADKFEAINDFLETTLLSIDPEIDGPKVMVKTVLDRASENIEGSFTDQPEVEASLRRVIGGVYLGLHFYEEAEPHLRRAHEIAEAEYGGEHPDTIIALIQLGLNLDYLNRREEAVPLLRRGLVLARRNLGEDHLSTIAAIHNLAHALQVEGELEEAEALFREAVERGTKVSGSENALPVVQSMAGLGSLLKELGRPSEAESILRQAVEASRSSVNPESQAGIAALGNLGQLMENLHRYDEAENLHREAYEAALHAFGKENPLTLIRMGELAETLVLASKHDEAEPILREAIDPSRRVLGEDHWSTMAMVDNLSVVLMHQGKLEEADAHSRQAMDTALEVFGEEDPMSLTVILNRARLLLKMGKIAEAEGLFRRCLEISERILGAEHHDTLIATLRMASLLQRQGKMDEAGVLTRRVLDIQRRLLGEDHPRTHGAMERHASLLTEQKKYAEAESLYYERLKSMRRVYGDEHLITIKAMDGLAHFHEAQGELEKAERFYREAMLNGRRGLGEEHEETLHVSAQLAERLRESGALEEAKRLYRRIVPIRRRVLGDGDSDTLHSIESLAKILIVQEKHADAEDLLRQVVESAAEESPKINRHRAHFERTYAECLIAMERFEDAEAQALATYAAIAAIEDSVGASVHRTRSIIGTLIDLYSAWGEPEKAEEYRALLESAAGSIEEEKSKEPAVPSKQE